MNWSGGKDSSLSLYKILRENKYKVDYLFTSVSKIHNRVSMHGVRTELLMQQAESIGISLKLLELSEQPDMNEYENAMKEKVKQFTNEGIYHSIFGDIFLEDLKTYREKQLQPFGVKAIFPLWKISTKQLMQEFLQLEFKAIVVCVNANILDKSFCGRIIDQSFVNDLPENVDVCGENGEYHSFVFDGPIFKKNISFKKGEIVFREYESPKTNQNNNLANEIEEKIGFYFCDLLPVNE
jgi:uncharacterized protein (TIGR00290 family)